MQNDSDNNAESDSSTSVHSPMQSLLLLSHHGIILVHKSWYYAAYITQ